MGEKIQMIGRLYNNIAICSLGIAFTLKHMNSLPLTKTLLIMPIIAHADLLNYLARRSTNVRSIEQLIVRKPRCFSNFNERFYDGLLVSLNSVQFLFEIDAIEWSNGKLYGSEQFDYDESMGKRAKKIFDASSHIAAIFEDDPVNLYTNLRIQI
jgi:hypothetical protein